jgi:hypothetical protein
MSLVLHYGLVNVIMSDEMGEQMKKGSLWVSEQDLSHRYSEKGSQDAVRFHDDV